MPDNAVEDLRFAGLSDMQAKTFARRSLDVKKLDPEAAAKMPKLIP